MKEDKKPHPYGGSEEQEPAPDGLFSGIAHWFKNYWYYYKLPVLIVLAAVALAVVFAVMFLGGDTRKNSNPDFQFVLISEYGSAYNGSEAITEFAQDGLCEYYSADEVNVQAWPLHIDEKDDAYFDSLDKLSMAYIDTGVGFFIISESLDEKNRYCETDDFKSFVNLAAMGYETLPGKPWAVDISDLPVIKSALPAGKHFAAIQDMDDELLKSDCIAFLDLLLNTP